MPQISPINWIFIINISILALATFLCLIPELNLNNPHNTYIAPNHNPINW